MSDEYTIEARLCDDDGQVSHEPVTDPRVVEPEGTTYLERLNRLRLATAIVIRTSDRAPEITEPFTCTGSAHLAGEHIRCTSPAHAANHVG